MQWWYIPERHNLFDLRRLLHGLLRIVDELLPVRDALHSPRNSLLRLVLPHLHPRVSDPLHRVPARVLPQRYRLLVVRF